MKTVLASCVFAVLWPSTCSLMNVAHHSDTNAVAMVQLKK
jgi:hypothetical protein